MSCPYSALQKAYYIAGKRYAGYLRVEIGPDQRVTHCDPAGPDIMVLPKQLQSPPSLRAHSVHRLD